MSKNADSGRIIHIVKQRERTKGSIEKQKQKLEEERRLLQNDINLKFTSNADTLEEKLKSETVGLVTLEKMLEKQKEIIERPDEFIKAIDEKPKASCSATESIPVKRVLSFADDDDDDEDDEPFVPKKRLGMDPNVDTSFLPDRDREEMIIRRKEELAREWQQQQEQEKNEEINVAFCYWDGSSHRRDTRVKKGSTINQFLQKASDMLRKDFPELRTTITESLMFVKEDLIIPHFYTFQDFIVTKAMGKTGPLWQFDAAGDIRLRQDAALDCGESHPVKVVLRSWFERNKHIYPQTEWEGFVPGKDYHRTTDDLSKI